MTKQKNKNNISENDALRMRVIAVKSMFRKRYEYTTIYEHEFGKQSNDQLNRIRAVWNLREVDKEITQNLEKIANKTKINKP